MEYICILLIVVILFLTTRLFFLHLAIRSSSKQIEVIEQNPSQNRRLRIPIADRGLEALLQKMNEVYSARQQERITYQKRENQIRQEIENISHDLRTPLTSILGYVSLLEEEGLGKEEREEYLGIIKQRAKVLQGFIQDFYEISRIEGDDYPILPEVVSVQMVLKETAVAYYHAFNQKQIEVLVDLEEKPAYIIVDKIQFNRILNNLIQNALKYAHKKFTIKQHTTGNCCYLQFINDSDSITPEELKLIFERFYTRDQSRSNQSTGLGLTITQLLVEKMNGQIEARIDQNQLLIEIRFKC